MAFIVEFIFEVEFIEVEFIEVEFIELEFIIFEFIVSVFDIEFEFIVVLEFDVVSVGAVIPSG